MIQSMFHLGVPLLEKILRPMTVYLVLILFLRLFGKRELAQLNPFDLVVLLCLSNTVQNAMIGDDNSVSGGVVGAFSLLAINWLLMRFLYRFPKVNQALEGSSTTLIVDGLPDAEAMRQQGLTKLDLLSVLHKQGVDTFDQVRKCVLEPNGTFYVESRTPSEHEKNVATLIDAVHALSGEVARLRAEMLRGS